MEHSIFKIQTKKKAKINRILHKYKGTEAWETSKNAFSRIMKSYVHGGMEGISEKEMNRHFERYITTTQEDITGYLELSKSLLKDPNDADSPYYMVNVAHDRHDVYFATGEALPIKGTGNQTLNARFEAQNLYERNSINAKKYPINPLNLRKRIKASPLPNWKTIVESMTNRAAFDAKFDLVEKEQADAVFAITSSWDWKNSVQGELFMTPSLACGSVYSPALYSIYFFGADENAPKNIFLFVTASGKGAPEQPFIGIVSTTPKEHIYTSVNRFAFTYISSTENPVKYWMNINQDNLADFTLGIHTFYVGRPDVPYIEVNAEFKARVPIAQVRHFEKTPGYKTLLMLHKGTLMKDLVKAYFPNSSDVQLWEEVQALKGNHPLVNELKAIGLDILSDIFSAHVWEEKPTVVS